ncbi:MobF family relaxase [Rhodanobacter sp. UC4437_H4]
MLSHIELTRKGGGATQAARYLFASEYYIGREGEQQSRVQWLGQGAEALGLEVGGLADVQTLSRLLEGYAPDGETKLTQNAGRDNRRLGHDLTFSADKSISLLFAEVSPAEREQLLDIHHRASEAAVSFLQGELKARRGHAGERSVGVAGLVMARVDHFSSRELQAQLHSHFCLANLALGSDGKWSTFDAEAFESHKHAAGALYRAEMARGLLDMGYHIDSQRELDRDGRETGQTWHRVAGIGQDALKHFSTRRRQIEDYMDEHGASAQEACLRTRQGKEGGEPDAARIMEQTAHELDDLRARGVVAWQSAADLRQAPGQRLEARSDAQILEHLHAHESGWSKAALIDALAKERGVELGAAGVLAEADTFLARNDLLELTADRQGRPRWASQAQHDLEQGITARAVARADDLAVRVDGSKVDAAIAAHEADKGFSLNDEQRRAVRWVAQETGGVACLTGRAGTGKTATAGAYIKAFQANGQRVIGACAAWDAADKLAAETGLETHSTAALLWALGAKKTTLTARDVVLVDEAGMVGAKTIAKLQNYIDAAGAKLVLVGDALQLQPVEAGAPFRLAQEAIGDAKLTEIRRQQEGPDRELAAAFYGKATGAEIVGQMVERGQLRELATTQEARAALVSAYLADPTPTREKLVIAPTNAAARALTSAIRGGLKARGELQDAQPVEVAGTLKDETRALDVATGDRLRFGLRDKRLGVSNGSVGVVEQIQAHKKGHRLTVRLESDIPGRDGRRVVVDTTKYKALDHGYAGTVHKAQGQGKESVYWHAEGGNADRHLALVAFTRTKKQLHAFSTANGLERLETALDGWQLKQNAAEMLAPVPAIEEAQNISKEQAAALGGVVVDLLARRRAQTLARERAGQQQAAGQPSPVVVLDTAQQEREARQAQEREAATVAVEAAKKALATARKDAADLSENIKAQAAELKHVREEITEAAAALVRRKTRIKDWADFQERHPFKSTLGMMSKKEQKAKAAAARAAVSAPEAQAELDAAAMREAKILAALPNMKKTMAKAVAAIAAADEALKGARADTRRMTEGHAWENLTPEQQAVKRAAELDAVLEKACASWSPPTSHALGPEQRQPQGQRQAHQQQQTPFQAPRRPRGFGMGR